MTDSESDRPPPPTLRLLHEQEATIECWCLACGRTVTVQPTVLASRAGWAAPFPEARSRLRCGGCGSGSVSARPCYPGKPGQVTRHT